MGLTINGLKMIQFPIVTQHRNFSRKINMKKFDIQIGVVQNFSRLSSIRKHFRINIVVTHNMSTYECNLVPIDNLSENKQFHQWNCIGHNIISNK